MRTMLHSIGATLIALTLSLGWQAMTVQHALALTSTSYQLHDTYGTDAAMNGGDGTTYDQGDAALTWYNNVLTSTSYQMTNGESGQTSSSSSSTSSSAGGGTTGGTNGGGGGGGGGYTTLPPTPGSVSSSVQSSTSSRTRSRSSTSSSARTSSTSSSSTSSSSSSNSSSSISATPETTYPNIVIRVPSFVITRDPVQHGAAPTEEKSSVINRTMQVIGDTITSPTSVRVLPWILIGTSVVITILNTGLITQGSITRSFRIRMRKPKLKLKKLKKVKRTHAGRVTLLAILGIALAILALLLPLNAQAANTTTPLLRAYNGTLLDSAGNPVTTAVTIRFSYWKSADYVASDTTGTGAINAGATNYVGWQEVQTVTPGSKGSFSVMLGSVTPLVDLKNLATSTLLGLYLQVEVKPSGALDTAYEVLDVNSASSTIDRSQISSVPFARNADLLDQHDTGTGSSDIPVLEFGGRLPISTMAGGTNLGTFTLDADNSETSEISLEFGSILGKKLTYDIVNSIFKFNASVQIQGNLTVTGLINGTDISSLTPVSDALKASSGAGLTLNVHGGSYRLNGNVVNYGGGSRTMQANATNYVFFGSGGLTTNLTGFPGDESYIPVAEVTTSAGAILSIDDRRITVSDDRERTVQTTFTPDFEKASYQGDGTDNVGTLSVSHDNITLSNFYLWTSTKSTLQDYDLLLRVPVSPDFVRWKNDSAGNPISFTYRTTSSSTAENKLDVQVYDTNGTPVTLSGSTTNLANTSWSTAQVEFTGTPVWTAGQDMLIRIKFTAKDAYQAHIGTLRLQHIDLLRE